MDITEKGKLMAKTAKRRVAKTRTNNYQTTLTQTPQILMNKPPMTTPAYDAFQYIKRDLKWSAIVAGIVVLVLIITYIFFH